MPIARQAESHDRHAPEIEFYPQIKSVHIAAVLLSVLLFTLRGTLVLAGRGRFAMSTPLRWTSYAIYTVLLTGALMLVSILYSGWIALANWGEIRV